LEGNDKKGVLGRHQNPHDACLPRFSSQLPTLKNWRAIKSSPLVRTAKAETYWPSHGEVELTPG